MAEAKKVSSSTSPARGAGKMMDVAPAYVHPILKRFWRFTREMAQKFSGNLLKDRTEELANKVNDNFRGGI